MARGSDAIDKPSNLTFGAEQFVDPAPMDEDEGVDGTGANSQGGMPCGSVSASTTQDLVENLGNLNSNAPMDEDEDVDKTGAASQGGCPHEDQSTCSAAGDQSGSMEVIAMLTKNLELACPLLQVSKHIQCNKYVLQADGLTRRRWRIEYCMRRSARHPPLSRRS